MPEAIGIPASGPDIYRNVVIPLHLNEESGCRRSRSARRHGASSITCCTSPINLSPSARPIAKPPKAQRACRSRRLPSPSADGPPERNRTCFPTGSRYRCPREITWCSNNFHPSGKAESEKTQVGLYLSRKPRRARFAAHDTFTLPADRRGCRRRPFALPGQDDEADRHFARWASENAA